MPAPLQDGPWKVAVLRRGVFPGIYQDQENKEETMAHAKYECPCGYVYDPAEGDYEHGIEPGTAFEDLPDNWVCPKCGAEKEYFNKM